MMMPVAVVAAALGRSVLFAPGPQPRPAAIALSRLLASTNITTSELSTMCLEAYFAQSPVPVNDWAGTIVVEDPDSVVQAVLYEKMGVRVLSFAGVRAHAANPAKNRSNYADAHDACLAAAYPFVGSDAESAWKNTCLEYGPVPVSLADYGALANALVGQYKPTLLTGHSDGCRTALSAGAIYGLEAVCFASTRWFTGAWLNAYPGLAGAISSVGPEQLYALQVDGDPYSNCLAKPESAMEIQAATCHFPGPPPGCNGVPFDYDLFSSCVEQTHWEPNMAAVPAAFDVGACVSGGADLASISVCPHQLT